MTKEFVHLHVHSEYSLLDGANRLPSLVAKAKSDGQRAIALTDHGNMFGALDFYNECRKQDIKPIIGCEVYVAFDSRLSKHSRANPYNHLTLLAGTNEGLENLFKLTSLSYIEGLSTRPRIDSELLARHSKGIVCLSGCLSGLVNRLLLEDRFDDALNIAGMYDEIFPGNFFLEIQRNGLQIQEKATQGMVDISKRLARPLVATNDIHYLRREDCDFQDTVLCINTGARKSDEARFRFDTDTLYTKSAEEMAGVFRDLPGSLRATLDVADIPDVSITQGEFIFPEFDAGVGGTAKAELERLVQGGLRQRYGEDLEDTTRERVDHELKVINDMGYPEYFLVVKDFVDYARAQHIPVGPGRGSAAGSIVAYALGITDVDPIRYNLLFERFLNSDRVGLPDIDIDFCQERRQEVIDYLKDKHGDDRVASIVTFGTFGQKAAIRNVGRALDVPLRDTDLIAKKLSGDDLADSLAKDTSLAEYRSKYPQLFEVASELEGMISYAGTHASGVVVADRPLMTIVPLARHKDGTIVTQWDLEDCEKRGLVKFDILGLETLTVIERAQQLIKERHGSRVDLSQLTFDDKKVYDLLAQADTEGVFQCFSGGMRRLLRDMQPDRFDDVVAAIALFRPGPLESGIARSFIERKHGREAVEYIHPDVEQYLGATYGTMVYQEQIMQLSSELAGFSLNEADELRKAVGKKKMDLLKSIKTRFLKGCKTLRKISEDEACGLWEDILKFGRYGFNLSHSASYAFLTYYTAYLKAYYPAEFFCANMTQKLSDTDKLKAYIRDAERHGIKVCPPALRGSRWECRVEDDSTINLGLGAVKGLGPSFVSVVEATDFPASEDYIETLSHLEPGALRLNVLRVLIKAGILDFSKVDRGMMLGKADKIMATVRELQQEDKEDGLFSDVAPTYSSDIKYDEEDSWSEPEKLRAEWETYGFYVSGHPMAGRKHEVYSSGCTPISQLSQRTTDLARVRTCGVITSVEVKAIKNGKNRGKKYARIILEDSESWISGNVFSHSFEKFGSVVVEAHESATPVVLYCKLDLAGEEAQLTVSGIKPLALVLGDRDPAEPFVLSIDPGSGPPGVELQKIIEENRGEVPLTILLPATGKGTLIRTQQKIELSPQFFESLESLLPSV